MQRKEIETSTQDEVQPNIVFYNIHKHNNTDTIIICTNILLQTPFLYEQTYQYKLRYNSGAVVE